MVVEVKGKIPREGKVLVLQRKKVLNRKTISVLSDEQVL